MRRDTGKRFCTFLCALVLSNGPAVSAEFGREPRFRPPIPHADPENNIYSEVKP